MTMIRSFLPSLKRPGHSGVQPLDRFSVSVPRMSVTQDFHNAIAFLHGIHGSDHPMVAS